MSKKKVNYRIVKVPETESEKVKKSLNYSVKDGAAAAAHGGVTNTYMSPFAIALGATNQQIGLLTSIANLLAPIFQLRALKSLRKGISRKKIVLTWVLLQSLILIPILLIPFLFEENRIPILIFLVVIYTIISHYPGPTWASWIGDLVPSRARGEYFGKRNRIAGSIALVVTILAGVVLNQFTDDKVFLGFALIFFAAVLFRLISLYYLYLKYEPEFVINGEEKFSLIKFVRKMRGTNFSRFVLYATFMTLAASISGPFFAVYMLKSLQFSYLTFSAVVSTGSIGSLLVMVHWGKVADKYGNVSILRITGFILPLLPILWIFAKGNLYFILAIQLIAGIVWSGFNLSVFNFINDSSTQQQRATFFTYFNILNGIGIFIGANLGGFLSNFSIPIFPGFFASPFFTVFFISGILRFINSVIFLPKIKEVRPVESGKPRIEFFGIEPMVGLVRKAVVGIYIGSSRIRKIRWRRWFGTIFYHDLEKLQPK